MTCCPSPAHRNWHVSTVCSDDYSQRAVMLHIVCGRTPCRLQLAPSVALSHAVYRQVTAELTRKTRGTPGLASTTDGRTAQGLATTAHRRYSGGILLSSLVPHNRTPNAVSFPAALSAETVWKCIRERHSSKIGLDTEVYLCSSSLF
jgi:hypothetical protein